MIHLKALACEFGWARWRLPLQRLAIGVQQSLEEFHRVLRQVVRV